MTPCFINANAIAHKTKRTVFDALAKAMDVVLRNPLRVSQRAGHELRHTDLIYSNVGVGGDDRSPRKVNALAAQVAAKPALFALEALDKTPGWWQW